MALWWLDLGPLRYAANIGLQVLLLAVPGEGCRRSVLKALNTVDGLYPGHARQVSGGYL